MAELERIHSHLLWLGIAGHEVGFDTLLMYSWRDRERVLDMLAMLGGNRVNYGINTPGGVRRDLEPQMFEQLRETMDYLDEQMKYYVQVALHETTLAARLSKVGFLSREDTLKFGNVGPAARASNVAIDTRIDDPLCSV